MLLQGTSRLLPNCCHGHPLTADLNQIQASNRRVLPSHALLGPSGSPGLLLPTSSRDGKDAEIQRQDDAGKCYSSPLPVFKHTFIKTYLSQKEHRYHL